MTIDERIEALTQSVELLASFHRDIEKRMDANAQEHSKQMKEIAAEHRDFARLMTQYAADVKDTFRRLGNIAAAHDERLDDHERRLDDLES